MSILIVLLLTETLLLLIFAFRSFHDIQKKKNRANTFAIQNLETGMNIRVYNASISDNAKIIMYSHHDWECMTWQFIEFPDGSYMFKNLYTEKSFEPNDERENDIELWQQPLSGKISQRWMIETSGENFKIRLQNTNLFLTQADKKTNGNVVLRSTEDTRLQLWRLVEQQPIF